MTKDSCVRKPVQDATKSGSMTVAEAGRKGGHSTSEEKAQAARKNGAKAGN